MSGEFGEAGGDGLPLYTEPIIGVRAFSTDRLHRLTPVTAGNAPWKPGENVSQHVQFYRGPFSHDEAEEEDSHSPTDCQECGFYAYTERKAARNHHVSGFVQVTGIVGGYGKVAVGPWGFRAEKAKVIALHVPHTGVALAWTINLFRPWVLILLASFAWAGMAVAPYESGAFLAAMVTAMILSMSSVVAGIVGESFTEPLFDIPLSHRRMRRLYPDTKFYWSRRAMLRRHKITPAEELTPENDPEFWTRPA